MGLFVALALVPGALAHHCNGGESARPPDQFSAQSVTPSPSPLAMVGLVLVPLLGLLAAVAIAIPSLRRTEAPKGAWEFNGTAYVWVPTKK